MLTPPTSNSNGYFDYTSSDTNVATINILGTVTIINIGTTIITATQSANGSYGIATITATLTVSSNNNGGGGNGDGALITPTLSNFPNINKNVGDPDFMLIPPTSNSLGLFSYTISDTTIGNLNVNMGTVSVLATGMTQITATQQSYNNYGTASISAYLFVNNNSIQTPNLSNFSNIFKTLGDSAFMLTAPTSNSNGYFDYTSSDTNVATINIMGTVTILNIGTTTITATQSAYGNYGTATINTTLTVLEPS
jgi:hypothetical protein